MGNVQRKIGDCRLKMKILKEYTLQYKEYNAVLKNQKEEKRKLEDRIYRTMLKGITIKSEISKQIYKCSDTNLFYTQDWRSYEKLDISNERYVQYDKNCPACGQSKENHCALVCGNLQQEQKARKGLLKIMCPKCETPNSRYRYREVCDLCEIFMICFLCKKKTKRSCETICVNCRHFPTKELRGI